MKYKLWFLDKYFLFLTILHFNNNTLSSSLNELYDDILQILYCLLQDLVIPGQNNSFNCYTSDKENNYTI